MQVIDRLVNMTVPHDEEATDSPRVQGRAPRAVWILSGMVGLEGLGLVIAGIVQTIGAFVEDHAMPVGAIMIMSLLYVGYGAWLLGSARSLIRGSLWPRALILLTQIFLVVISVQLAGSWGWGMAAWPIVYGALVAVLLFSQPVQSHLLRANGLAERR
ncbi:hypothetical protein D8M21_02520 [Kocuria sp. HSID16901]|nr:hypothetical protein D8M21_02520 [Kocuria sp. HSID16901]